VATCGPPLVRLSATTRFTATGLEYAPTSQAYGTLPKPCPRRSVANQGCACVLPRGSPAGPADAAMHMIHERATPCTCMPFRCPLWQAGRSRKRKCDRRHRSFPQKQTLTTAAGGINESMDHGLMCGVGSADGIGREPSQRPEHPQGVHLGSGPVDTVDPNIRAPGDKQHVTEASPRTITKNSPHQSKTGFRARAIQ